MRHAVLLGSAEAYMRQTGISIIVAAVNYNSASTPENCGLCKILGLKPISHFTLNLCDLADEICARRRILQDASSEGEARQGLNFSEP
jgi:hypothetical protein